jgi:hypothetical protein
MTAKKQTSSAKPDVAAEAKPDVAVEAKPDVAVEVKPDATLEKKELLDQQSAEKQLNDFDELEPVYARVLIDTTLLGVELKPNQVISASSVIVDRLESEGVVCSDDAAVEYCESIGSELIKFETK